MAGIASSLAQGFESGYGLGLRTDKANEDKRRHKVGEEFQAKQDQRAEAELGLRTRTQDRLEQQQTETLERGRAKDTLDVTGAELKDLIASAAGGYANEDMAQRYGHLVKTRQAAIDLFTRAKAGQADPKALDPDDFYIATAMATGRTPEEIQSSPRAISDLQAGHRGQEPVADAQGRQRRAGAVAASRHWRDERVRHDHPQGVGRARPGPDARRLRDPTPARLREHALR